MKFSEVVDSLMEGKPISRTGWENGKYMYYDKEEDSFVYVYYADDSENSYELGTWGLDLEPRDVIAEDWDIDIWDLDHIVDANKKVDGE